MATHHTTIKTVTGYTAQARYYAANMATQPDSEDWVQLGWVRVEPEGYAKPVFQLTDGRAVAIFNGKNHLAVIIVAIPTADIRATEDECFGRHPADPKPSVSWSTQ